MIKPVRIGTALIGPGQPCYFTAEIGINHNGSLDLAKRLIAAASEAGCDAVKFQKRTVDVVYTADELSRPRENPFGPTNGHLKRGLEFDEAQYTEIDRFCRTIRIPWFASPWDEGAADFLEGFDPPCYKVASACLTDDSLLRHVRGKGRPVILSTGMSSLQQIDHAVEVLGTEDLILMHCTSTYPAKVEELNLRAIPALEQRYRVPVGYSGHETTLYVSLAAVALGACMVERHITLDRTLWGTDQAASVEPHGLERLVKNIRTVEKALGDGVKRVYESELSVLKKLRRVGV